MAPLKMLPSSRESKTKLTNNIILNNNVALHTKITALQNYKTTVENRRIQSNCRKPPNSK
jgi:hypothetical protein